MMPPILFKYIRSGWALGIFYLAFCTPAPLLAEDFSFDVEEFEKKSLETGGYAEFKWEHINLNEQGALDWLNRYDDPANTLDRLSATVQLKGSYVKEIVSLNWLLNASGYWSEDEWDDEVDVFETYGFLKPTDNFNISLGKKAYKWGKGYAWNPTGFLNRMKDPNNPDEALEGYITAEAEVIKSFTGNLKTLALTTVLLPVTDDFNDDFGKEADTNIAARMYLLLFDTDLDMMFYTGDSKSTRFGVDFSRNITSNFEVHGEYAYFPEWEKVYLQGNGNSTWREEAVHSYLFGIRHLTEFNLTSIIEYYHNGGGYSSDELDEFYDLVNQGAAEFNETAVDSLLQKAKKLGQQGYTKPYLGTDYLYGRFSFKEPWDILYFTPALTVIYNLDDESYTITPELIYTGFTNWEFRLRFSMLGGGDATEYGEKLNQNKVELRVRWFY
jgi:hypothetical protein